MELPREMLYVKLPEDEGAPPGKCGKLLKGMHGTQDAPHIWQTDYGELMRKYWHMVRASNTAILLGTDDEN